MEWQFTASGFVPVEYSVGDRVYLRGLKRNLKKQVTITVAGKDRFIARRLYFPRRHD